MQTYTKINTLYKRYAFDGKDCPNAKWLRMRNKIIMGDFSDKETEYLFNCLWEAYSKLDGTNSKIAFFPSTQEIKIGAKSDSSNFQRGQAEKLQEIADRIKPILCEMFPKETARFVEVKGDDNKVKYYDCYVDNGVDEDPEVYETFFTPKDEKTSLGAQMFWGVKLEEIPIYIYGEYYGNGVQKCGRRYIENGNDFKVFDICQQGWWIPKDLRDEMCAKLGLETVPYLGTMTLREIEDMVKNGFTTKLEGAADPSLIEEGIVARPVIPLNNSRGKRIIVKVKYRDYKDYINARKEFTDEEFAEFEAWYKENALATKN